jgi:hypothetical protein
MVNVGLTRLQTGGLVYRSFTMVTAAPLAPPHFGTQSLCQIGSPTPAVPLAAAISAHQPVFEHCLGDPLTVSGADVGKHTAVIFGATDIGETYRTLSDKPGKAARAASAAVRSSTHRLFISGASMPRMRMFTRSVCPGQISASARSVSPSITSTTRALTGPAKLSRRLASTGEARPTQTSTEITLSGFESIQGIYSYVVD